MRIDSPQPPGATSQVSRWFRKLFLIAAGIVLVAPIFVGLFVMLLFAMFFLAFLFDPAAIDDPPAEIDRPGEIARRRK